MTKNQSKAFEVIRLGLNAQGRKSMPQDMSAALDLDFSQCATTHLFEIVRSKTLPLTRHNEVIGEGHIFLAPLVYPPPHNL